jgi:hypothetical protein
MAGASDAVLPCGASMPLRPGDSACFVVERAPPWRVVRVEAEPGHEPVSPALIGLPAAFIVTVLEPEQATLLDIVVQGLICVRPGTPQRFRYRSGRYGRAARLGEIIDPGEGPYLLIYCREGSDGPYDPCDPDDQHARWDQKD